MTADRRRRLLRLATIRRDLLAVLTLSPSRPYRPEPDYPIFVGLRWLAKAS